jgi:hypothetical protein
MTCHSPGWFTRHSTRNAYLSGRLRITQIRHGGRTDLRDRSLSGQESALGRFKIILVVCAGCFRPTCCDARSRLGRAIQLRGDLAGRGGCAELPEYVGA